MTERHAAPAPLRGLRLLPGDTQGDTAAPGTAAPEGDTSAAPVPPPALPAVPGAVTPITMPERVGTAVRRLPGAVAKAAGELWLYPDRLIHAAWHGNAKTLAQHRDYVKAREWVPPEMTGKPAAFVTAAGIAYHVVIARYVKAACKAVDGSADYPLRFLGLLVFLAILIVLLVL